MTCFLSSVWLGVAAAAPAHAVPGRVHPTADRPGTSRNAPSPAHRPEAQRPGSRDLWNPLKRKRMAMPPPPSTGVDYAF